MFLPLLTLLFLLSLSINRVYAGPVPLPFSTCAPSTGEEPNPAKRINVTAVYGQIYLGNGNPLSRSLKLTALAEIGDTLDGYSNQTALLCQYFSPAAPAFGSSAFICSGIRLLRALFLSTSTSLHSS